MTYRVTTTRQFDRDVALLVKRGADLGKLYEAVGLLAQGGRLPAKYRDHALRGQRGCSLRTGDRGRAQGYRLA